MSTVRASWCPPEHGPAGEEVGFVGQNSGPGVSVVACPDCAACRKHPAEEEE